MSQLEKSIAVADALADVVERRHHERISFHRQAWVVPLGTPEARYSVVTQDISVSGVGFIAVQPFVLDQRIVLCLDFDPQRRQKLLCRVRRCRPLDGGLYDVGAQFEAACATTPEDHAIPAMWLSERRAERPRAVLAAEFVPDEFA